MTAAQPKEPQELARSGPDVDIQELFGLSDGQYQALLDRVDVAKRRKALTRHADFQAYAQALFTFAVEATPHDVTHS